MDQHYLLSLLSGAVERAGKFRLTKAQQTTINSANSAISKAIEAGAKSVTIDQAAVDNVNEMRREKLIKHIENLMVDLAAYLPEKSCK
jgi:molybdenum cofactor biosynthesis enzyme MoaA